MEPHDTPAPAPQTPVRWGALVVSMTVIAAFIFTLTVMMTVEIPTANKDIANSLLGVLATMAVAAVNYWTGSSAGSARKDDRLADIAARRDDAPPR